MARNYCPTCGASKDVRAKECQSCGMSRKAKLQWANPELRKRTHDGTRAHAKTRRQLYEHISLDTNWSYKKDGRAYTFYWEGDIKRYIYRYQWVWKQAYGPIPDGHSVHHLNHDMTDDRIENLAIMEKGDHCRLHEPERREKSILARGIKPIEDNERYRSCEQCNRTFAIRIRSKANRFCSLPCYHSWQKG